MDNMLKNILLIIAIIVVLAAGVAAIYFVAKSGNTAGDFVELNGDENQVQDDRFDALDQMNQDLLDQIEALRRDREDALIQLRDEQANQNNAPNDTTATGDETASEDAYNMCLADVSAAESNAESAEDDVKDFENELEDEIDNINDALADLKIAVQAEDALLNPSRVPPATTSEKERARDDVRDAEDDLEKALDDFDNALDDLERSWKDEIDSKRELRDTTARCAKVTQESETINYNSLTRALCPAAINAADISLDASKDFTNDLEDLESDVDDNSADARARESAYQVDFDAIPVTTPPTLVKYGNGVKDARDAMDDWEQAAEDLLDDLDNDIEDAQDEEDDFEKDEESIRRTCARL